MNVRRVLGLLVAVAATVFLLAHVAGRLGLPPLLVTLVVGTIILVTLVAVLGRQRAAIRLNNQGLMLQQEGRFTEAAALLEQAHQRMPRLAIASLNLGVTYLVLYRFEEAIERLLSFEQKAGARLSMAPGLERYAGPALALSYVFAGKLDQAAARLTQLEGVRHTAVSRLAQVALSCRRGDFGAALDVAAQHGLLLDQLGGTYRAWLDALVAWASTQLGRAGGSVDAVRLFREVGPERLNAAWPQLAAFVTAPR